MRTDPGLFESYFRMSYDQFQLLLSMVRPRLIKESHRALKPGIRLAITLRYLASGMAQKDVALEFLVGVTTASNVIRETLDELWHARVLIVQNLLNRSRSQICRDTNLLG